MEQILIIVQGLVYSGPVATLLANRLSRGRSGTAPVAEFPGGMPLRHFLFCEVSHAQAH